MNVAVLQPVHQKRYEWQQTPRRLQAKLRVNEPGDVYEREADVMANRVMQMQSSGIPLARVPITGLIGKSLQRKCAHCEEEEKKTLMRKEAGTRPGAGISQSFAATLHASKGGGSSLAASTKTFMEEAFNTNFSSVRVHTDEGAAALNDSIHARAFTYGSDIYFNKGEYAWDNNEGKKLLAHELTHVVQQQHLTHGGIQRAVRHGADHGGEYDINTAACTLNYKQDWYFNFESAVPVTARNSYMTAAERQVEGVWSHQHPIKSDDTSCPCHTNGFDVAVDLVTHAGEREGRHGYSVDVNSAGESGFTNQPLRTITLDITHDTALNMGGSLTQQRIAHEFGHTIGVTDEYHGWTNFWHSFGAGDRPSIMHSGDQVRPRHYQQFADIINQEFSSCTYHPEGFSSSSLANPVVQLGINTGVLLNNASFVLGLHIDRRMGNTAFLGLFYPHLGFDAYLNTSTEDILAGPSIGLRLNRLVHPLFLDIGTGVLFDPGAPGRQPQLNIPASVMLGLRGNGFQAGVNYTGMFDLLNEGHYSHIVGVNLSFDL